MTTMLEQSQAFAFNRNSSTHATAANSFTATPQFLTYSYFGKSPQVHVYDKKTEMAINPSGATANAGKAVFYDQSENTINFILVRQIQLQIIWRQIQKYD